VAGWRERVLSEVAVGGGVISARVYDELAYRLVLAWLRDDGETDPLTSYRARPREAMRVVRRRLARAWAAVDSLDLELSPTDHVVVERAKFLMTRLAPRDAFHAAHALTAGCGAIASADPAFDSVKGLRRIAP
jgi:predicted nucleic acid-binding protein